MLQQIFQSFENVVKKLENIHLVRDNDRCPIRNKKKNLSVICYVVLRTKNVSVLKGSFLEKISIVCGCGLHKVLPAVIA